MTQQAARAARTPQPAMTIEAVPRLAEDPRWLERVARGAFCLMWLVPLDAVARLLFSVMTVDGWGRQNLFWIRLVAALSAAVFAACGGYFLSLHNPADAERDRPSVVRRLLWIAILSWVVAELLYTYLETARNVVFSFGYRRNSALALTARQAGELLAVIALSALMVRLLRVTRRTLGGARADRLRSAITLYIVFLAVAELLASVTTVTRLLNLTEWSYELHSLPSLLTPVGATLMSFVPLLVLAMFLSPSFYELAHTFRRRGEAARQLGLVPVGVAGFAVLQHPKAAPHAPAAE